MALYGNFGVADYNIRTKYGYCEVWKPQHSLEEEGMSIVHIDRNFFIFVLMLGERPPYKLAPQMIKKIRKTKLGSASPQHSYNVI